MNIRVEHDNVHHLLTLSDDDDDELTWRGIKSHDCKDM